MSLPDQFRHETIHEGQHQRINMRAVDIGIGHDNDFVVAELADIKVIMHAAAESRDHRADFFIGVNSFFSCLFDIENLAAQRKNRLRCTASRGFRGASRGISLDQKDFTFLRILVRTVCQLSGQRH